MVERENKVAVQHYISNPWTILLGEKAYRWIPRYNISLAWIDKEDLDKILAIKTKSCCGKNKARFFIASQTNVNIWETGNR